MIDCKEQFGDDYAGLYCIDTSVDNLIAKAGKDYQEIAVNLYECSAKTTKGIQCAS
jgi:hypothetical protein